MPELNWNAMLAALAYAALTGIFNLIFANKSQINAWCEANPRLAAALKITRALGLDPQHLWAALALVVKKRLPAVQTETLDEAPKSRAVPPLMLIMLCLLAAVGCSSLPITSKRCSFDNPEFSAQVAMCRSEIERTCLLNDDETPRADCPALVKCEAWRKEQCR